MVLKLREDYKAANGREVLAAQFHDTLLGNGTVPLWLHRALMLGDEQRRDHRGLIDLRTDALIRVPVRSCSHRFERIQKFSDPPVDVCPCGGTVKKLLSSPAIQFKGSAGTSPTTRRSPPKDAAAKRTPSPVSAKRRERRSRDDKSSTNDPSRIHERSSGSSKRSDLGRPRLRVDRAQILAEGFREVRPPQREIDDRLQEPQLVAGVVPDAVDAAAVDRAVLQQPAQSVGQLDLAGSILASPRARGRYPASGCSGR